MLVGWYHECLCIMPHPPYLLERVGQRRKRQKCARGARWKQATSRWRELVCRSAGRWYPFAFGLNGTWLKLCGPGIAVSFFFDCLVGTWLRKLTTSWPGGALSFLMVETLVGNVSGMSAVVGRPPPVDGGSGHSKKNCRLSQYGLGD